jgi:hypothetical protein
LQRANLQDLSVKPIDKNLYWTGIIYFAGLCLLHVAWWQAVIVAIAMSVSWYLTYSRRVVGTVGTALLLFGLAAWLGLAPTPSYWLPLTADASHHPAVSDLSAIR